MFKTGAGKPGCQGLENQGETSSIQTMAALNFSGVRSSATAGLGGSSG
jgi:hypothetical protein